MTVERETLVISVGGSLLVPDTIDTSFIASLKSMTSHMVEVGYRMVLVIGGGKTSRNYSNAAKEFNNISNTDLDWIGIKTIALNCEFVRRVFSDLDVYPNEVNKNQDLSQVDNDIIIVGAWEPGHSSDYNAVTIARQVGARRVINFSNISHVYDSDPANNPNAKEFKELTWGEYRDIIPTNWVPNMSAPFDPIASKKAQELGLAVVILGASIENMNLYLNGDPFDGTVIS